MKQLKPIRFDSYIQKGGSTKPWNIACIDESINPPEEIQCVLKLFKPSQVLKTNSIGKEFVCNLLATEFDLIVPEPYLVEPFDVLFRSTLEKDIVSNLYTKHKGLTFCSRLVDASIVNPDIKNTSFNINDCAMIFAFDCLVMNQDRGGYRHKSNLLIDDDGLILIDHELTFHFLDGFSDSSYLAAMGALKKNSWLPIYLKHIFYGKLKDYRGSKKLLFNTFEEYLNRLDVSKIEKLIEELNTKKVTIGQNNLLINYLYTVKQNANKFTSILLNIIS